MLADQEGAGEVDVDHPLPLVTLEQVDRASACNPGGMEHAVEPAGSERRRLLDDGGDRVLVADVDAAEVRQVGGRGEVGAEHGRALGHEARGGGAADAGRSAGDQHGSVLKGRHG